MSNSISSAEATSIRLDFLSSSANLLAHSSPAISAHLMRERDDALFEHELYTHNTKLRRAGKLSRPAKNNIGSCQACSTIAIPGRTCEVNVVRVDEKGQLLAKTVTQKNAMSTKRRKRTARTPRIPKALKTTCLACHTWKLEVLPSLGNTGEQVADVTRSVEHTGKPENLSKMEKNPANAGSKARAKARKHSGLQAMLTTAKERMEKRDAGGLMDWMESG